MVKAEWRNTGSSIDWKIISLSPLIKGICVWESKGHRDADVASYEELIRLDAFYRHEETQLGYDGVYKTATAVSQSTSVTFTVHL